MPFSSLIGQDEVKKRLGSALTGTPGHAYVLSGPDGIGKTSFAYEFAAGLLCPDVSPEGSCGKCASCRYFAGNVHPDFRALELDAKEKNIKVEKVRQRIRADLNLRPQLGARKVYLIDADYLNEQGQNALLKSLEEPPDYVHFIMTIISPERLLQTIMSRVNHIALKRYSVTEIGAILQKNDLARPEEYAFYARFSGGLAGVALDLAGSEWFAALRAETVQLYSEIALSTRADLLTEKYKWFESNREYAPLIFEMIGSLIRDQLICLTGDGDDLIINRDKLDILRDDNILKRSADEARQSLLRAYAIIISARRGLDCNASFEGLVGHSLLALRKELSNAKSSRNPVPRIR